jgi:hypothetical protein
MSATRTRLGRGVELAQQFVHQDDIAEAISCGPDVAEHVKAVQKFVDAGFTDVAVIQIGGETQSAFLDWAEQELLPALRAGSGPDR